MKDFMTRVCIGKHEDFYEEHLGKSRVYPARVAAVRTVLVPQSFDATRQNGRLNSTETNIARRINVPLICGDSRPWQRERKVIGGIFSRSSPKSMDERLKKGEREEKKERGEFRDPLKKFVTN